MMAPYSKIRIKKVPYTRSLPSLHNLITTLLIIHMYMDKACAICNLFCSSICIGGYELILLHFTVILFKLRDGYDTVNESILFFRL